VPSIQITNYYLVDATVIWSSNSTCTNKKNLCGGILRRDEGSLAWAVIKILSQGQNKAVKKD
jgi:hypothetical protein